MDTVNLHQRFYNKWAWRPVSPVAGYSLLLPLPGDLPVFLRVALEVCGRQDPDGLVETLVIADQSPPGFEDLISQWIKQYSLGTVRVLSLNAFDAQLIRAGTIGVSNIHWLQVIKGVTETRTTHALLHDADVFITEPDLFKTRYRICLERGLACLGAGPTWQRNRYEELGINHLVATYEMVFDVSWAKSFPPYEHRCHENIWRGKPFTFDTTLWPQCQTSPQRIECHAPWQGFIHFGHVVGSYRLFQRRQGSYEDERFALLLIRLLIDAYDESDWTYEVPSLSELTEGLFDAANEVTYLEGSTRQRYSHFRHQLQQVIQSGLLSEERTTILERGVASFDGALGWTKSSDGFGTFPSP